MKKLLVFLMVAGFLVAGSGMALASLSWQTAPVLGTSTYIQDYTYPGGGDHSDVIVVTDTGLVNIPHNNPSDPYNSLYAGPGSSMTFFHVGQTVDAGSGIYYTEGDSYAWSVVYTGPTRIVTWGDTYPGNSGEGFVESYLDPVSTLLLTDVGIWNYTETWTNISNTSEAPLSYSTGFTVGVPEPATMLLLGLGLMGLAGIRRKFRN